MCLIVYLASDTQLELIEEKESGQALWIMKDENSEILKLATGDFVYYVVSYIGCGCGFYYEDDWDDISKPQESVSALKAYLMEALRTPKVIDIIAFWSTTEQKEIDMDHIMISEITGKTFDKAWNEEKIQKIRVHHDTIES